MPLYIGRAEAVALYAEEDDDVDESHVFQGDLFSPWLELAKPMLGNKIEPVVTAAIVISHHCEFTKAKRRPEHPILVAPLHELADFPGQEKQIANNDFRYLLHLPADGPVATDFVADFRLIQPVAGGDLSDGAPYLATCGPELHRALQAKVIEFVTRILTLPGA